eukprot:UN02236
MASGLNFLSLRFNGVFVGSKRFGKTNAHLNIMFQDSMGNDHTATLFNYERASFVSQLVVGNMFTFRLKWSTTAIKKRLVFRLNQLRRV